MSALLVLAIVATVVALVLLALTFRTRRQIEEAKRSIEERERRYRSLFESSFSGIALVSEAGHLVEWNARLPALLGLTPPGGGGNNDEPLVRGWNWQPQALELAGLARHHPPGEAHETSLIGADGERRTLALRHWPMALADDSGTDSGSYWLLVNDVTQREETRTLLRLARQTYQSISEAILITDVTTRIIDVNPAFECITGFSRDEALGMRASLLRSDHHDQVFFDAIWKQLADTGCWRGEIWNRCRDGRVLPCWMHIDAIRDPSSNNVTHYVGVFSDISERKLIEERISFLAHHDSLTGLANRFSLEAVLPQSIALARRQGSKVAVLFVDLDRFKEVNDTFGHATGDEVLIETGRRLSRAIRDSDFLARIGGDEFVVLLNEISSVDDAALVASTIREALHGPIHTGSSSLVVTPSIGISLFPEDGEEADSLLAHADAAMYRVKTDGRDNLRFYSARENP